LLKPVTELAAVMVVATLVARLLVPHAGEQSMTPPVLHAMTWATAAICGVLAWLGAPWRPGRMSMLWIVLPLWLAALGFAAWKTPYPWGAWGILLQTCATIAFALTTFTNVPKRFLQDLLPPLVVGAGLVLGIYALLQVTLLFDVYRAALEANPDLIPAGESMDLFLGRLNEAAFPFVTSNVLGGFLAMILPVLVGIFVHARHHRLRGVLTGSATLLCIAGLIATGSTGAWIAAAGGMSVSGLWLLSRRRSDLNRKIVIGVVLISTMGLVSILLPTTRSAIAERSNSMNVRFAYWDAAVETIRESPWTGIGVGHFRDAVVRHKEAWVEEPDKTHNVYLGYAAEAGIPTGVAFLTLVLCVLLLPAGVQTRQDTPDPDSLEIRAWIPPLGIALGVLLILLGDSGWNVSWDLPWVGTATTLVVGVVLAGTWFALRSLHFLDPSAWIGGALAAAALHMTVDISWSSPGFGLFATSLTGWLILQRPTVNTPDNRPVWHWIVPAICLLVLILPARTRVQHRQWMITLAETPASEFSQEVYEKAEATGPGDADVYGLFGGSVISILLGEDRAITEESVYALYDAGWSAYTSCIRLNPITSRWLSYRARLGEAALKHLDSGAARYEEILNRAVEDLFFAVERHPTQPWIRFRLGTILARQEGHVSVLAAEQLDRARELHLQAPQGSRLDASDLAELEKLLGAR
jgi:hypothetical protein